MSLLQKTLSWNFTTKENIAICAGPHTGKTTAVLSFASQLVRKGQRCMVWSINEDLELLGTHPYLLFCEKITTGETIELLLEEECDVILIDNWEQIFSLLQAENRLEALDTLEEKIKQNQLTFIITGGIKVLSGPLAPSFNNRIYFPFLDPHDHVLTNTKSENFVDFPPGRARCVGTFLPINADNSVQLALPQALPLQEACPHKLTALPPRIPSNKRHMMGLTGLNQKEFLIKQLSPSLLITCQSKKMLHATYVLFLQYYSFHNKRLATLEGGKATTLDYIKGTDLLVITDIHLLSNTLACEILLHIKSQKSPPLHIVGFGDTETLISSFCPLIKYCRQEKHGIIITPEYAQQGMLFGQKIHILPAQYPGRAVYFSLEGKQQIIQLSLL